MPHDPPWTVLEEVSALLNGLGPEQVQPRHDGTVELFSTLNELRELISTSGDDLVAAARLLAEHGLAGPRLRVLADGGVPIMNLLRHQSALSYDVSFGVGHVVRLAAARNSTFGRAWAELTALRPLIEGWLLPDDLAAALHDQEPSQIQKAYFTDWTLDDLEPGSDELALRAIRLSAVTGRTVRQIVDEVEPLLALTTADLSVLHDLVSKVPGVVVFDDLLLLATQQFSPPVDDWERARELAYPAAEDKEGLAGRAKIWIMLPIQLC
jgi:hypothetical protein